MAEIKRDNTTLGTVVGFVRQYESVKINTVSLEGIPYMQTPGVAIHKRLTNVFCDTYEKRDAMDTANNEGALMIIEWNGQTFRGFIEDKRINWKEWRDGHGVGRFTFVVKEVVDE